MKIKMRTTASGPAGVFEEGKVYDVEDPLGNAFVGGGYAEWVEMKSEAPPETVEEAPAEVETAEAAASLTAEKALGKGARRKSK